MEDKLFELLAQFQQKNELSNVVRVNQHTKNFGLQLTEQEAAYLLARRKEVLKTQERIELNGGILDKLIFAFCDSPYIYQSNYVETLQELQEMFYYAKSESLDNLSDDELIECMKNAFDGTCRGSIEYLRDTYLEGLCRRIREEHANDY